MKRHLIFISLAAITAGSNSYSAVSDEQFEQLRSEMFALAQRVNSLETENAQLKQASEQNLREIVVARDSVQQVAARQNSGDWTDSIKLKGDFRYRYENIDEENKDDRDRNRIRARAAIIAKLPDNVEVGLGFASGGDDPVSTNQTLGGGGSSKELRLDLAYFNWGINEQVNVLGGKYKNVWYRPQKNQLMWDGDYNPEGLALTYKGDLLFGSVAGTWLESDTKNDNDSYSWGAQAGIHTELAGAKITAGAGYFQLDTAGKEVFFGEDDDFFGNSFECDNLPNLDNCTYLYDYNMIEVFADISTSIGDLPVSFFADYVKNDDADDYDTGWAAGVKLGKAKQAGGWQVAYTYQDLEADAVFGLLSDSDFGGGGTDGKGHIFKGAYAVNKKWSLGLTYFANEIGEAEGDQRDYNRIQLDTKFKY
jgi:hypothetical protein